MRKPREERRTLNVEEMQALHFTELKELDDEDGWPYPDYDPGWDEQKAMRAQGTAMWWPSGKPRQWQLDED